MSKYTKYLKKCDDAFREQIRERDAGKHCCYCDRPFPTYPVSTEHPLAPEVCHYIPRRKLGTRFHPMNAHLGHRCCNQENNKAAYTRFLIQEYGKDTPEELERLGNQVMHWSWVELREKYEKMRV